MSDIAYTEINRIADTATVFYYQAHPDRDTAPPNADVIAKALWPQSVSDFSSVHVEQIKWKAVDLGE